MRDILNDLEAGKQLSDPDPVRRAQIQMKAPLPKRFYKEVSVVPVAEGHAPAERCWRCRRKRRPGSWLMSSQRRSRP